jgi:chromosome segregation ATPase
MEDQEVEVEEEELKAAYKGVIDFALAEREELKGSNDVLKEALGRSREEAREREEEVASLKEIAASLQRALEESRSNEDALKEEKERVDGERAALIAATESSEEVLRRLEDAGKAMSDELLASRSQVNEPLDSWHGKHQSSDPWWLRAAWDGSMDRW